MVMLAHERQRVILDELRRSQAVRTIAVAARLGVSDQTIRRDLLELEERGLLRRLHGGATTVSWGGAAFNERDVLFSLQKAHIARAAVDVIRPGMTVALGPGTTTKAVAEQLNGLRIRLITNSVAVARAITDPAAEVLLTGGRYRPDGEALTGDWAHASLANVFADISLIGVSGVSEAEGYTVTEADEARILRDMIRIAKRTMVLCDSSKFYRIAGHSVAPLSAVHAFVTDAGTAPEHLQMLESQGVEVTIARPPADAVASRTLPLGSHEPASPNP